MRRKISENIDGMIILIVAVLILPLTALYHIAFGQMHYTALMVVVCVAIGLHMLSPFTPPRYKKTFDLTVMVSLLLLVLLGVMEK